MSDPSLFELDTLVKPKRGDTPPCVTQSTKLVKSYDDEALFTIVKPPYLIPPMKKITDKKNKHGLKAVSTFSGGGGSSTGMHWSGWTVPFASEFIPMANATYKANFPTTHCDSRDIRQLTVEDILNKIGLDVGELDLFEGSPPCSSFSRSNTSSTARYGAGKVKAYSDGVKQSTDDLFSEWLRLAIGLHPRAVLAENVPALGEAGEQELYYADIIHQLNVAGYDMRAGIFYADRFGAATSRPRLFLYGIRKDRIGPDGWDHHPTYAQNGYTMGDAIGTCPESPDDELDWASLDDRDPDGELHYAVAKVWYTLRPGESPDGSYFNLIRSTWDKAMPTITATGGGMGKGAASVMHPDECRYFTATEAGWLTGFPPDYKNLGSPGQRYERIARAVPPPMYRGMGHVIARALGAVK